MPVAEKFKGVLSQEDLRLRMLGQTGASLTERTRNLLNAESLKKVDVYLRFGDTPTPTGHPELATDAERGPLLAKLAAGCPSTEAEAATRLLLKSLAERPGHVKNRDQLMDAAYGETIYVDAGFHNIGVALPE